MLNPETSSDSPSAKSNGVRFVSATQVISHNPRMGGNKTHPAQNPFPSIIDLILLPPTGITINKIIKPNLTS